MPNHFSIPNGPPKSVAIVVERLENLIFFIAKSKFNLLSAAQKRPEEKTVLDFGWLTVSTRFTDQFIVYANGPIALCSKHARNERDDEVISSNITSSNFHDLNDYKQYNFSHSAKYSINDRKECVRSIVLSVRSARKKILKYVLHRVVRCFFIARKLGQIKSENYLLQLFAEIRHS